MTVDPNYSLDGHVGVPEELIQKNTETTHLGPVAHCAHNSCSAIFPIAEWFEGEDYCKFHRNMVKYE